MTNGLSPSSHICNFIPFNLCSRFLERASTDKAERLDKHRFLVQAKEIDDDDYYKVVALPVNLRGDEVRHCTVRYSFSVISSISVTMRN